VLRIVIPSATACITSCQIILGTFFISILGIRTTSHHEAAVDVPTPSPRPSPELSHETQSLTEVSSRR
jgi:hypothetical protein